MPLPFVFTPLCTVQNAYVQIWTCESEFIKNILTDEFAKFAKFIINMFILFLFEAVAGEMSEGIPGGSFTLQRRLLLHVGGLACL